MQPDFSGYATKSGLLCSDGRTIMPDAFKHQDKQRVPLVWQHGHGDVDNVLGHAVLEARPDGVYAYGYFNKTDRAQHAKELVQHGDISFLSIYANKLVERSKQVFHGAIREVSLVIGGANPGALIDYVSIQHSDGDITELDDEAVIFTGIEISHSDVSKEKVNMDQQENLKHADNDRTVGDVFNSMSDEQKNVVYFMIGAALEEAELEQSDDMEEGMVHNVFEGGSDEVPQNALTHDDVKTIVADAARTGSLKQAAENFALSHGINDISILFPEARTLDARPEWDKRRTEWVADVLGATRKSPFSRIKTRSADLTHNEARAKGYIKGEMKKEEFFGLAQRTTGPTTVYKKQKLDRDDILDITDFDVVAWMKEEMRIMLDEELARAILIGDGREVSDVDKIKDPVGATDGVGIRSIANDNELYAIPVSVSLGAEKDWNKLIDAIILNRSKYKGTGTPTFYTTEVVISNLLLLRDGEGRRLYRNIQEIAAELRVATLVPVEAMEGDTNLYGIVANLADYAVGADKGGEVALFDDFDIDYNQHKYLIETRVSGALTKLRSALVVRAAIGG